MKIYLSLQDWMFLKLLLSYARLHVGNHSMPKYEALLEKIENASWEADTNANRTE